MAVPYGSESREVELDGLGLRYLTAGDSEDPVIVLLHGGGLDSASLSWKEVMPALAKDFRVVAPDLPGYGESDPPERTPTTDYYVRVLERFLPEIGVEDPVVVGVSMGGGVAVGYALEHADDVSALVAIDGYGLGGSVPGGVLSALVPRIPYLSDLSWRAVARSRTVAYFSVRAVVGYGNVSPTLVDEVYAEAQRNGGEAWRRFQRAEIGLRGPKTNYVDRLPDVSVPSLFVHGEDDRLVPQSWSVRAGSLVPDAEVRILPNCGHWPPREKPNRVNALIRLFLQSNMPVDM
ncbi:alpha/beta fold hydrolase [Halopelagius longus]|uniref:Alpha/beta hydrolase n=1 Tax=Halopelagius longus TaxID=1236180 RepID=A0A1H1AE00_9EURY|nr:alpha/beta hydrolase [Halopelagius longus]RDI70346.1 alpha/beta hydrolase [Halopelagius longus]SDQ37933.1 Pimeloyl-ACP methyl ester carboxylesterase [Halopelagius longus]